MASDVDRVEPNVSQIIDGVEAEQVSSMREGLQLRFELQPIPNHAMISGKGRLQDGWNSSLFGSSLRGAKPGLIAANIIRVSGDEPTTIQNGNELSRAVGRLIAGRESVQTGRNHAGERTHSAREFEESSTLH